MDLKRIGGFIAKKRIEKGLTQKQLSDLLMVSDKTISKWECGRGMAEVSLLLPLCEILGITVNELLSAEELDDKYEKKAEENMLELIKEKENIKLSNRKLMLWQVISITLSIVIWAVLFLDSNVYHFGDDITALTMYYLLFGFIFIYATVSLIGFGLLNRHSEMLTASLAFACLACLAICLIKHTYCLLVLAVIGLLLIFLINVVCSR